MILNRRGLNLMALALMSGAAAILSAAQTIFDGAQSPSYSQDNDLP